MIPPLGWEHSHGKTQYIPGKQVLVRSWLWTIYIYLLKAVYQYLDRTLALIILGHGQKQRQKNKNAELEKTVTGVGHLIFSLLQNTANRSHWTIFGSLFKEPFWIKTYSHCHCMSWGWPCQLDLPFQIAEYPLYSRCSIWTSDTST